MILLKPLLNFILQNTLGGWFMKWKLIVGLVIAMVSIQLLVEATSHVKIKDISKSKYPEAVRYVIDAGYMNVDTNSNFNPKQQITREQLAKILKEFSVDQEQKNGQNIAVAKNELVTQMEGKIIAIKQDIMKSMETTITQAINNEEAIFTNKEIEVVAQAMDATVIVYHNNTKGSGVFVATNYILTANHAVTSGQNIEIALQSSNQKYKASIVKTDSWNDLALLKLNTPLPPNIDYTTLNIASNLPKTGEAAFAFGHPQTLTYSVTKGIISSDAQTVAYSNKIQFDGQVQPGYSGGALVNRKGELIGIITSILKAPNTNESYYGISFAAPPKMLQDLLEGVK